jgi:hypothetical protein
MNDIDGDDESQDADKSEVSIRILDTHSKLVDEFGQVQGSLYPHNLNVPQEALNGALKAIAKCLWEKVQCIGFITVRFVASWDYQDEMTRILATEITFGMSNLIGCIGTNAVLRQITKNKALLSASQNATKTTLSLKNKEVADTATESGAFFKNLSGASNASMSISTVNPVWVPDSFSGENSIQ